MMQSLQILVVDDEVNIRKTLSVCLETEGHKVFGVRNFQDALIESAHRSFDLAFVDLRLGPEVPGGEDGGNHPAIKKFDEDKSRWEQTCQEEMTFGCDPDK